MPLKRLNTVKFTPEAQKAWLSRFPDSEYIKENINHYFEIQESDERSRLVKLFGFPHESTKMWVDYDDLQLIKTTVVFREDHRGVYALFPEHLAALDEKLPCDLFVIVGGHGVADFDHCIKTSSPYILRSGYDELCNALTNYGYALNVVDYGYDAKTPQSEEWRQKRFEQYQEYKAMEKKAQGK